MTSCVCVRLKSEAERRLVEREEERNLTQSKHTQELAELQNQLQDSDTTRQTLQQEVVELRERIDSIRQEHTMDNDFMKELQQRYDRDMHTLQEEYSKTKHLHQTVSTARLSTFTKL